MPSAPHTATNTARQSKFKLSSPRWSTLLMVWLAETTLDNLRQVILSYQRTSFFSFYLEGCHLVLRVDKAILYTQKEWRISGDTDVNWTHRFIIFWGGGGEVGLTRTMKGEYLLLSTEWFQGTECRFSGFNSSKGEPFKILRTGWLNDN